MQLQLIDDLCQRWGQTPSVIRGESVYDVLQMVALGLFAQPEQTESLTSQMM